MAVTMSDPKSVGIRMKKNTIARGDTTAKDLFVLPKGAVPLFVVVAGETASDAGTSADIDVGTASDDDLYVQAFDVKTAGTGAAATVAPLLEQSALTADTLVKGLYAETGTAGTTGGPWTVNFFYIYP